MLLSNSIPPPPVFVFYEFIITHKFLKVNTFFR
nr:MAG TPA: hypothetical protein [Caudoviricetes sp.]